MRRDADEGLARGLAWAFLAAPAWDRTALVGAAGAALTATIRRGGLILAILVVPLMVPTLIFGVTAASLTADATVPFTTPFLILAALTLVAGVVGTAASAAILRAPE